MEESFQIELTQGKVTFVDGGDFKWLSQWKWHAAKYKNGKWYAQRTTSTGADGRQHVLLMHRAILGMPVGVDHKDNDGLNNRRSNLRIATNQQNQCNAGLRKDNKSGYKGVGWHKDTCKFQARIAVNGKRIHLGLFSSKLDAARKYNDAARIYHGEFAKLNVV